MSDRPHDPALPRPRNRRGRAGSDPAELSPLGRAIDASRRARGLSLLRLAARLGVSRQHLYRLLRTDGPLDPALRERLERVLGAPLPGDPPTSDA